MVRWERKWHRSLRRAAGVPLITGTGTHFRKCLQQKIQGYGCHIGYHQRIYSICSYTHTLHRKTKGREIIHNANKFPKVYPFYKFCSKDALVPRALPKKAPSLPQPLRTTTTLHRKSPHMLPGSEMDRTQSHPCRRQS